MKFLKSPYQFIFESVESYEFSITSDNPKLFKYQFFDMIGNKYLVEFKNIPIRGVDDLSNVYELLYYVYDNDVYSVSKIVNVNPYRVIHTVFNNILNDFIKKCPFVEKIFFVGLSKERERNYVTSRTRIYKRYLDMNPPKNFMVRQSGNLIQLIKFKN